MTPLLAKHGTRSPLTSQGVSQGGKEGARSRERPASFPQGQAWGQRGRRLGGSHWGQDPASPPSEGLACREEASGAGARGGWRLRVRHGQCEPTPHSEITDTPPQPVPLPSTRTLGAELRPRGALGAGSPASWQHSGPTTGFLGCHLSVPGARPAVPPRSLAGFPRKRAKCILPRAAPPPHSSFCGDELACFSRVGAGGQVSSALTPWAASRPRWPSTPKA